MWHDIKFCAIPRYSLTFDSRARMTDTRFIRFENFIEPIAFVAFVALYIWRLQFTHVNAGVIFPVWLVASFVAHRRTPKALGWRADNLWPATRQALIVLGACMLGVALAGLAFGALHRLPAHLIDPHRFFGYFSFCLLQQIALNSYLMNRFLSAIERPWIAAGVSAVVFAALHWPNPVLVPLTLLVGFV